MPCWYFERKEIKYSPSYRDGIDTSTECRYRREGARFIIDAGTKMGLRYDTCATGVVFFHRFYMFHSFKEFYRYVTASCCLMLAGKVEETPKKCKDIIRIAQSLLSPSSFARFGEDPREEVMTMERILLKTIKFDLQVEHPYSCMLKFAKHFKGDREKIQKMAQMAWTFINDSLCTTLSLQWEPEIIAVSLMYLASRLTKFEPSEWSGRASSKSKWYEDLIEGMSMELMEDICHQVLDLYSAKQKKPTDDSPPQSPAKGGRQGSPPPPPPPDRTPGKRSREVTPSESDRQAKLSKIERDPKGTGSAQVSSQSTAGAPIPVAQHISTTISHSHHGYSSEAGIGNSEFSSLNPYVSSQMFNSSFMSQEGSQNIQSILAGKLPVAPPPLPPTTISYTDPLSQPALDTSQYPHPTQPDPAYSYNTPPPSMDQTQYGYAPPPSHSQYGANPAIPPYPPTSSSLPSTYDPYSAAPSASYPPHHYPPTSATQNYPPPPQSYSSYYPPPSADPPSSNYPPPSYPPPNPIPGQPQHFGGGPPRHRGNYQKQKHNPRKEIPALTDIKITGRPDWNNSM